MNEQSFSRARLGRLAGTIGGLALVAAVGLAVWQGGLTAWGIGALVLGVGGVVAWIASAPGDFNDWLGGRGARHGGFSVISTLIFVAVIVALYGVAEGANVAVDMTLSGSFTLSPPVLDVLDLLDRPVVITGFYSGAAQAQRDADDEVFHLFEVATDGLIRVVYIDPTLEPALAAVFGVQYDGTAFVTFSDPETGLPAGDTIETIDTQDALERSTANAILRLLAAGDFRVYFTTGHGEPSLEDVSPDGLSFIAQGTTSAGLLVGTLDPQTIVRDGIPADATAVIIPGARTRFTAEEVDALAAYLDRGGNLFVAADVPLDPADTYLDAEDPLRALLRDHYGLVLHDALVVDEASSFQSPVNAISASVIEHPVSERITDSEQIVFFYARAMTIAPYEDQPESLSHAGRAAIVLTSDSAYGETDLQTLRTTGQFARDDADLEGPLALVAVAQDTESGALVLVTADADFMNNAPVGYLANRYLYTDGLAWLTQFFESVEIEPAIDNTRLPIFVTEETMTAIFLLAVVGMPGAALALGVIVWRRRQRR